MAAHLLLPPSEGKAPGGTFRRRRGSFPQLLSKRAAVAEALADACADVGQASKLLGARGDLLDRALEALTDLVEGTAPTMPAWRRYTGTVWQHLDPATLPDEARARLLVPSALMGITTGTDPVPDHRLRFSASLPGIGRLDRWWRNELTDALIDHLAGGLVVDLLPNEHAAALDWTRLAAAVPVVRVQFVSADGARAAGHAAKAAKGRFARAISTRGLEGARRFRWQGWHAQRRGDGIVVFAPPAPEERPISGVRARPRRRRVA